jgi:amidase
MNRRDFLSALGVTALTTTRLATRRQPTAPPSGPLFATACDLAERIRRRRVTAIEVLDAHLAHVDAHNSSLNALVTLDTMRARQRAREADEALRRGEIWGPLHGVPVTLEDAHATAGLRSTWGGFPALKDHVPSEDGTVAARLRSAGAIIFAKTNGPAIWPNGVFPATNNPWDTARSPGGSSAGPGAAVAAGLTPLDVGLDTLGSLVSPAHNCGVYTMRPTERRVGLTGADFIDRVHKWRVMMVPGPMARSLDDLELAVRILAGPDGHDSEVPAVPWREPVVRELKEIRVAWTSTFGGLPVASEIQAAVKTFARQLSDAGATVSERLPDVDFNAQSTLAIRLFEIIAAADEGSTGTLHEYFARLQDRDRYIGAWDQFLQEWDAFACPAGPIVARRQGTEEVTIDGTATTTDKVPTFDVIYALSPISGCPAVVLPLGHDSHGLPFGVLLMAQRWEDERLLMIAKRVSSLTAGFHRPPGY